MSIVDGFLDAWVDVPDIFPWLPDEPYLVSRDRYYEIKDGLNRAGLAVAEVDLTVAATEENLLALLGQALSFPDYYGENWDALRDILRQKGEHAPWQISVMFTSSSEFAASNIHAFVRSIAILREISMDLSSVVDRPYGQLELFYLGDW